ncbi:MAG: hypothetical protein NY202_03615 [Mollicutes bacterium UO1]
MSKCFSDKESEITKNLLLLNKNDVQEQEKFKQLLENNKHQQIRKKPFLLSCLFFCQRVWQDTMTIAETAKYKKLMLIS